jgi:hypothetical protein
MIGVFDGVLEGIRGAFDFVSGVNDGNQFVARASNDMCLISAELTVVVVRHPNGEMYCSQFFVQSNAAAVNRCAGNINSYIERVN